MSGLVALIGDPVAHSVSPEMQDAAFAAAGIDLHYRPMRVTRDDLAATFSRLRAEARGLNVTTPLKEAILRLLDEIAPRAREAGSVNTVVFGEGGRASGDSTDGAGFMRALRAVVPAVRHAVILGTGGAARAVAAALAGAGATVDISGRDLGRAERFAREIRGTRPLDRADLAHALAASDLLVNATPIGSVAVPGSPISTELLLPATLAVFDLVYRPRRTALLERARRAGCPTIEGVEMLVEQGALSFTLWTGRPAPLDVMREAASRALNAGPAVAT